MEKNVAVKFCLVNKRKGERTYQSSHYRNNDKHSISYSYFLMQCMSSSNKGSNLSIIEKALSKISSFNNAILLVKNDKFFRRKYILF